MPSEKELLEIVLRKLIDKWTYKSIAAKYDKSKEAVEHIIKTFKRKHKTESRARLAEQRKKSRKITQALIDFVTDHLKRRIGRRINVKGILLDLNLSPFLFHIFSI